MTSKQRCRVLKLIPMLLCSFLLGMKFDNVNILRNAIVQYSVKNSRQLRYVKNMRIQLRVQCQDICPWVLYAYQQPDKSLRINTLIDEHTWTIVWKNKRVNLGFLVKKYVRKFRSDPNVPMSSFMETVKEDCMYEILKHQFYRTRSKCAEVINGIIVEQYKILWDYSEELNRTSPGSTVEIEGLIQTFKRLHIYLRACKEGFRAECRPVVGLDGCFVKCVEGRQSLAAVGIDGENCMFLLAWAVVYVENKSNWQWFIELLVHDIGMHNPRAWIFISDKQKGLVDFISQYYEGTEHRCCARYLYRNFTMAHKGLALKNLFWTTAVAE
ncbi:uncharacterized protein LOC111383179 [Olea europaea var. sylvestris]|uniref:uncharacterized protein LOC111383179 n=1 Tax=Olea europaea var. sylvestris TaxID=158386 RepID=UPI000C1CD0BB|nr:uncharacterized protein LOC111383179 [Olea europaea var. sylvestris]